MSIRNIEQRITDREVAVMRAEIKRGAEIIIAAIKKYTGKENVGGQFDGQIAKWLGELIRFDCRYPQYELTAAPATPEVPSILLGLISSYAGEQFLGKIEEIAEVAVEAQEMASRAQANC